MSTKRQPRRPVARRLLTMYSGVCMLGSIEEGRSCCVARNATGDLIGRFDSRIAAMKAISAASVPRPAGATVAP
jgi:hypothetical protein